jgi:uncharacterized protein (TIGR00369 family)
LQYLEIARSIFDGVPFLRLIGVTVQRAGPDEVLASFGSRPDLIGNPHSRILHGGVISSVMDSVGGLVAIMKFLQSVEDEAPDVRERAMARMTRLATIDMRSDYLSPGRGDRFFCEGTILRLGRHVIVSRMSFRNDDDALIAVGTGTYNY